MRTRLKDVADKLQLSTALVSGVLNKRPNVWASEETRERILRVAQELNYQPSAAAQALSRGRTDTVVFVYRRLEGFSYRLAYSGLVDALSDDLQTKGYDLVVANFGTQEEVLDHLRKLAGTKACDAVILWGREEDTEPQGRLLDDLGIPFLVKGRHEVDHPHWNQIDFDHEGMMRRTVEHLASLGHTRLAYLGFPHDEGFVHALRRGFVESHRQVLGTDANPFFIAEHPDEVEPNEETIDRWLNLPPGQRPTGFVIGAGNAAWQSLETCLAQYGKRLGQGPDDFAAAGIASLFFRLMFGEAVAFQGIEIDNLARLAGPGLLNAILKGEDHQPIHRFLPELSLAPSLNLLRHGVTFQIAKEREVL
jgi:LacI family transcriptional regulator